MEAKDVGDLDHQRSLIRRLMRSAPMKNNDDIPTTDTTEIKRLYDYSLFRRAIQTTLDQGRQLPLVETRYPRKPVKRCAREIPGERVQFDTCEIADELYQYTAIDDCTRMADEGS